MRPSIRLSIAVAVASAFVATGGYAQQFVYPAKGQSPEQVTTDQSQCGGWATQQTGYNPNAPATTSS